MAVNHNPGPFARVASLVEDHASVDDHGGDADRILERVGERGAIGDRRRIEDHEVGGQPFLDQPAIRDVQLRCGEAAHLVDRLLERDDVFLAHVLPRTRGKVPKLRGCGTPLRQRPLIASADPSDPTETHGCCIASFRSFSSMMNHTQPTLPLWAIRISNTKS